MKKEREDKLIVKGARTHNLKDITVEMPRNSMVVFTGLSGSGKSSLAFDTIFAEGQRRYVESLSSYARQFLRQMQKPDVDEITGLSPAISIDQKSRSNNPRSTVATITEIYDYLRVLYARIGRPHCLICGEEIRRLSVEEIKNFVLEEIKEERKKLSKGTNKIPFPAYVEIFAPVVKGRKGEYYQLLYDLLGKGYNEVVVDNFRKKLRERIIMSKTKRHDIDVLVDQINLDDFTGNPKDSEERLFESLERGLHESEGLVRIVFFQPVPVKRVSTSSRTIPNKTKQKNEHLPDSLIFSSRFACPRDGFSFPEVEPRLFSFNSPYGACPECHGLGQVELSWEYEKSEGWQRAGDTCPNCKGARLRPEALSVLIGGKNIVQITAMAINDADKFFEKHSFTVKEKEISKVILKEIQSRLKFMINVGIEYLSLNRRANTLSGGEAQRIRLASQLGSGLVGALYVLDEPTIGLHARDNDRLIKTLLNLRDLGNTIIVVEHDEDTIFSSDYIVDLGPGAGVHGGKVVVAGYLDPLLAAKKNTSGSRTLAFLREEAETPVPKTRRREEKGRLLVRDGKVFSIANLDVDVPLGRLIAVTGVSGSGKSSFLYEILYKNLQARLEKRYRSAEIFNCKGFDGTEYVGRVILVDQSPIGRTPRSNPATYTGAWTFVRELFAETSEARVRGWKASRFSFNVKGGRCESCQGNGEIAVEMHFLPTVYVTCDVCQGKRFMKETLEVEYKKKNIHEVLKMTVEEALGFFEDIPAVYDRLKTMDEVGLGYLELGQSATTLSGGEAQRVKISAELYRPHLQKTVYLLDEPTIGLHYDDVGRLIAILQKLVDHGNTVVVIEHNMDFIKSCDYIIDFGPEGGDEGGKLVAKGTPEEVVKNFNTHTTAYLKRALRSRVK